MKVRGGSQKEDIVSYFPARKWEAHGSTSLDELYWIP